MMAYLEMRESTRFDSAVLDSFCRSSSLGLSSRWISLLFEPSGAAWPQRVTGRALCSVGRTNAHLMVKVRQRPDARQLHVDVGGFDQLRVDVLVAGPRDLQLHVLPGKDVADGPGRCYSGHTEWRRRRRR